MDKEHLTIPELKEQNQVLPVTRVHTLVVGSGAAGLNAAVQLFQNGIEDLLILTEGLEMGTSINTGSDKQTYYKLSLCGDEADSPLSMAQSYFGGGSMHGDLALVEAALSTRAFMHLVNLGVPFPRDRYGQFVGYKTDHDPRQRATSIGPYTSREMCRQLIKQIRHLNIPVREQCEAVQLVVLEKDGKKRIVGVLALNEKNQFEGFIADNVIFAVGGPGGLYQTSVYPKVHSGAIGLALMEGAQARGLPESQYGLASIGFRWNVSGTYMQVIPRFISRDADGIGDEREFLPPYFDSMGDLYGKVFLKGYQWPFDARKVIGGSSLIDILVYHETMVLGRRVYLDFRQNPAGFQLEELPEEARQYLVRSQALQGTPIERLQKMNPGAIELYREHDIDLFHEPLEVAVCAQHNNGGLAANIWWESTNIKHLFPVGEVNGSHGVSRPGGSALNAGQVGGIRAAEYIAKRYSKMTVPEADAKAAFKKVVAEVTHWLKNCQGTSRIWQEELKEMRERMSRCGAQIRGGAEVDRAVQDAWRQVKRVFEAGAGLGDGENKDIFRARQLVFAQAVYLNAISFALHSGVGSRGSSIVLDPKGQKIHSMLPDNWRMMPEDPIFRLQTLETQVQPNGVVENTWVDCRPLPAIESWFETTWALFREGEIYDHLT
jgi:succinate dehydrogenase/fumarate reductase flavoprotein subunit